MEKQNEIQVVQNCCKCGVEISEKVAQFSADKYGKVLCFECQKSEHTKEAKSEDYVELHGKRFITHKGLLNRAHKAGITELLTIPVKLEDDVAVFSAISKFGDKEFQAHGDATPNNVGDNIKPHYIRMAETRAINRSLRLALNISECSQEEV